MRLRSFVTIGLAALATVGCRVSTQAPEPAPAGPIAVQVVDEMEFAAALESHRGKVVLVDFWATWCGPCRALFPHNVELYRRYASRGLVVMTVSLDDPKNETGVLQFLQASGASFPNFISRYGTGSRSVEAFQVDDGAIPYLKLYDRQGKLRRAFGSGGEDLDPDRIGRSVEELL